jgi:thiamine-monophosphate kinase
LTLIGDDAAAVPVPPGDLLLTADAVVAGVHADLDLVGIDDLGWKAIAVNVSDVAAMGGRPLYALVTVAGPLADLDVDALYEGLLTAADAYACPIVGGDLTAAPVLMVSVAVAGTLDGHAPVLRSGASPGDLLFVTGPLGSSAAGLELLRTGRAGEAPDLALAHRRPRARVAEGTAARTAGATAMIDISDGLSSDVRHVAAASGVGVALDRAPVAVGVARAMGDDGVAAALGGGEDYELLFAAPDGARVEASFSAAGLTLPLLIGRCTPDPTELLLGDQDLPEAGWEHTF